MPGHQLVIFVKAPRAGFVKTRLAEIIGSDTALDTYQTLVEVITTNLASYPKVDLHFTPAEAETEIRPWLNRDWTASPQCEGELGERLTHAFHKAFERGNDKVVIIGSDCPYVKESDIEDAFTGLAEHDVTIGPAADGGYWLIGLSKPTPELFTGINWSTETVLAETLDKARLSDRSVKHLRELSDVDTVGDLVRFHEWSLAQTSQDRPA